MIVLFFLFSLPLKMYARNDDKRKEAAEKLKKELQKELEKKEKEKKDEKKYSKN